MKKKRALIETLGNDRYDKIKGERERERKKVSNFRKMARRSRMSSLIFCTLFPHCVRNCVGERRGVVARRNSRQYPWLRALIAGPLGGGGVRD